MTINDVLGVSSIYKRSFNYRFLENHYEEFKEAFDNWFKQYSEKINEGLEIIYKKINTSFFYDRKKMIGDFLEINEFNEKVFESVLIYVSATEIKGDYIGLIINLNTKKIEFFEGNEDVSDETHNMIQDILGNSDKSVIVYSSHNTKLVNIIEQTNKLPKDLYVSPDRKYAESYWSIEENRILFSCKVPLKYINQESDVDWKTVKETPITDFKFITYL